MARRSNSYNKRKKPRNQSFSWRKVFVFFTSLFLGLISVAFVLLVFVFSYRWIIFHPVWQLRDVAVKGNSRVTFSQILEQANLKPYQSSLEIQIDEVQKSLEQLDWIQDVAVKRVLPNRLEINIKEKEAFFWVQEGASLFYADRRGEIIYGVEKDPFVSLPVLYVGNESSRELVARFVELVNSRMFPLGWHEIAWVRLLTSDMIEVALLNGTVCLLETEKLDRASNQLAQTWRYMQGRDAARPIKKIIVIPDRVWVEFAG